MTASVGDLKAIINTGLSDADLQVYLDDAATIIAKCSASGWSDAETDAIHKYVAAHLIAQSREPEKTSSRLGDAQDNYARPQMQGPGLQATQYGRMALTFDSTGCLAKLGKQAAFMRVL